MGRALSAAAIPSMPAGGTALRSINTRAFRAIRRPCASSSVAPAGIEGIAAADKARPMGDAFVYGALGVGGTKMKIHRAALQRLFVSNDACLDAEDLLAIGEAL